MSDTQGDICNHEWKAPRKMVNSEGKAFETMPVNHICGLTRHTNDDHICVCGEHKEKA